MRMLPSQYLRIRAKAIFEDTPLPKPLDRDWMVYTELTRPQREEWFDCDPLAKDAWIMHLLLAAAMAESEGQ